jgi:hypothetical protein
MQDLPPIVTKAYDLACWLLPRVNDFPRSYRFILGDRVITVTLDLVEGLIDASHLREKRATLEVVSMQLNRLRFLIRLSKDLKLLTASRYEYAARAMNEIGAMLGGWLKQQGERKGLPA